MRATASEIRHGKIRTYEKGSESNNALLYDLHLIVSLENKAHSVTLICNPSLVLCNFKAYRLRILYFRWIRVSMIFNLFLKFAKFEVNSSKLYYYKKNVLSSAVNRAKLLPALFRVQAWSFIKNRFRHRLQKYALS